MIIKVISKFEFNSLMKANKIIDENVSLCLDTFFISINDTKTSPYYAESWFKKDHDNVKVLYFDDVESEKETSPTNSGKCTPFSEKMAEELYTFIKKNLDKSQCLVHCMAGIARSGGVASVVADMTGIEYKKLMRDNPQICPNQRVVRLLNRCRREDISSNLE